MPNPQITFPAAFAPAQAVAFGNSDNSAQIVSATSPLPVTVTNAGSGGGAVTIADGADVALGAKADSAATSDSGAFSLIALTKRLLGKLPASLGQKVAAASLPVVLPSDMGALAVSAASLPLPTGAATSANQATTNTSLANIAAQLPASLGQKASFGSLPVVLPSDMAPLSVSNTDGVLDGAIQTGSVTSAAVVLSLDTLGYAAGSFQVSSIGTGNTITFEQSNDGTNWAVLSVNVMTGPWASYANTLTATGFCAFAVNSRFVRARVSTYGSGTVTITSCLKRAKGAAENSVTAVLGTSASTIGVVSNYVGYQDSITALAASATFTGSTRAVSANVAASYFNVRAYADQAGTLYIDQSLNSGSTWEVIASAAVTGGVAASLSVRPTGAANSTNPIRVRYVNGATAQSLFRLSSSFTVA